MAVIVGTPGYDVIRLGPGFDTVTGGGGSDLFDLTEYTRSNNIATGADTITDFAVGDSGDMLRFPNSHTISYTGNAFGDGYLRLRQLGADTLLERDTDGPKNDNVSFYTVLVLKNVNKDDLTAYNFYGNEPNAFVGTTGNDNLTGNSKNSVLAGLGGNDTLTSLEGNDNLYGNDGNDSLSSGSGNDNLYGGNGSDLLDGGSGNDTLQSGLDDDTLIGGSGNDVLYGESGNDKLIGGTGNDTLVGTANANDTLSGGTGQDSFVMPNFIEGGNAEPALGRDIITDFTVGHAGDQIALQEYYFLNTSNTGNPFADGYARLVQNGADTWLQVDSDATSGNYAFRTIAILRNVNKNDMTAFNFQGHDPNPIMGTADDNSLTGNSKDNMMTGGVGNDTLVGLDGNDSLYGQAGNDSLSGGDGDDKLDGGTGQDAMAGGDGSDTYLVDDAGDVVVESNASAATGGIDLVISTLGSYTLGANIENGRVDLYSTGDLIGNSLRNTLYASVGNNVLDGGEGAEIDTASYEYASAVNIRLAVSTAQTTGGSGKDTLIRIENLTGSYFNDTLTGSSTANELNGGAGNDTLAGGGGKDVLTGGAGNDVFDFNLLSDSGTVNTKWDVITDFVRGQDKVDLSSLDANTATAANDAFTGFVAGTASFTSAGQLRFSAGVLYGNTDADAAAEFAVELTGISALDMADLIA